jgi:hypothetical protein
LKKAAKKRKGEYFQFLPPFSILLQAFGIYPFFAEPFPDLLALPFDALPFVELPLPAPPFADELAVFSFESAVIPVALVTALIAPLTAPIAASVAAPMATSPATSATLFKTLDVAELFLLLAFAAGFLAVEPFDEPDLPLLSPALLAAVLFAELLLFVSFALLLSAVFFVSTVED